MGQEKLQKSTWEPSNLIVSGKGAVEAQPKLMLRFMLLGGHLERGEPLVPTGDPQRACRYLSHVSNLIHTNDADHCRRNLSELMLNV